MSSEKDRPLVWLPFDPSELGDAPYDLRYEIVDFRGDIPDTAADVEVYVPPFILGRRARAVIEEMSSLKVVQTLSAGVDHVREVVPDHVTLCNGRGIHDTSTAELAVALTLSALRGIPDFVRQQAQREWRPQWRPSLADRTVLLVGYGAIGAAIEARLSPFECEVVRVARRPRDGVHAISSLPDLLPEADVVIMVVPLTSQTRGMVDQDFLARMREGALLVNVARGGVIVTDDLVKSLHAGRITAALDVVDPEPMTPDSPLYDCPGLLVTPHVGGSSTAMWPRAHRLVRDQLWRFSQGQPLANVMHSEY